jgi:hypothetical protein
MKAASAHNRLTPLSAHDRSPRQQLLQKAIELERGEPAA